VASTDCGYLLQYELLSVDGHRLHVPYMHTAICGWQWPRIEYRVSVSVEIYDGMNNMKEKE
jgi:hypothetical protein